MRVALGAAAALCLVVCVPGCRRKEPEKAPSPPVAAAVAADRSAVLAELPADASDPAAPLGPDLVFAERGGGVAYVARSAGKVRVVHDGRPGAAYDAIGSIALSADGRRCAVGALTGSVWHMVVDGKEGAGFDAVDEPAFSPDGAHVAYLARRGETWHLVVDERVNGGVRGRYAFHGFGADSSRIAFVEIGEGRGAGRLVVSDPSFAQQKVVDPLVLLAYPTADRKGIVAIGADGERRRVLVVELERPEQVRRGKAYDAVQSLDLVAGGLPPAYRAELAGAPLVVFDDREEPRPAGLEFAGYPVVRPDKKGFGVLVASEGTVRLRELFAGAATPEAPYDEAESLVYSGDGRSHAYAARRGDRWFVVADGHEGPPFDRVVSPAFSPDGKVLVYRARNDGKRFVVIAATDGKTLRQLPAYEQVFPVGFTADGASIAYGVKDGRQLARKVEPLR